MAETNVMGIFEFPPNIFDKILDRFSLISIRSLIMFFGVS